MLDNGSLIFFGETLPALMLAIRVLLWWLCASKIAMPSLLPLLTLRFWLLMFTDSLIALAFSSTYQTIAMEFMKQAVGAPRPIYHALNIWASVGLEREGWFQESHRSFPSGHSATVSAGMGVVIFFLLKDAWLLSRHHTFHYHALSSKILAHAALIPAACIIFVGVSRIRDYWHFAVDVGVGWAVGLLSAAFGFLFFAGHSSSLYLFLTADNSSNDSSDHDHGHHYHYYPTDTHTNIGCLHVLEQLAGNGGSMLLGTASAVRGTTKESIL